jgi:4-amino-4-deoxy-L-arabinose transferase-like glycosyltransferase
MMQAFVIVPVVAVVYLVAGSPRLVRRLVQLLVAGVTLVVSAGWWVAVVELWPSASRPYIGGSQDNSLFNLILGYNGFGRLTGNETGSVGGLGGLVSTSGPTGWERLFLSDFGSQISWLIPAALIMLGASLWFTRGAPRTDPLRSALLLCGGWLLLTAAVFSFAQGIIHPYYTIALAPPIGALVGIAGWLLWKRRADFLARLTLAAALAATTGWSYILLSRSPDWYPSLRLSVLIIGTVASVLIAITPGAWRRTVALAAALGLIAALSGPAAYTLDTVVTAHSGAIPSAGPAVTVAFAGGQGGGFGQPGFGRPRGRPIFGGPGQFGGGAPNLGGGAGLLNSSQPTSQLVALLSSSASRYVWAAATIGANSAAGYQLATGDPMMAIGGFNGTDPAPTLAQFQKYVSEGKIHYFIGGGRGGGIASGSTSGAIATWVSQQFTSTTLDGVKIYDLTAPTS